MASVSSPRTSSSRDSIRRPCGSYTTRWTCRRTRSGVIWCTHWRTLMREQAVDERGAMDNVDPVKASVRAQDPFKDSARTQDPFKDSVRAQDPFKDSVRGGEGQNLFGGGGCLAVVAFIGPVGLDVGQLAARMLSGGGSQGP